MERKPKVNKKIKQEETTESKTFNKNFYGKKVETSVGINKNKTAKKWQPNDDLNELNNQSFDGKEKFSTERKSADSTFRKKSSSSYYTSERPLRRKSDDESTVKKTFSGKRNIDDSKPWERKDDAKTTIRKSYTDNQEEKKYKSAASSRTEADKSIKPKYSSRSTGFSSRSEKIDEAGAAEQKTFKRKSIYDRESDKKSLPYKKSYKPISKGPSKPRVVKDPDDDSIRLNKFISNAGICSRREADELIKAGAVTVNGKIITEMGFKIKRTDLVNYGGQGLKPEKHVYILLNKPKDYITTSYDPQERRTVLELIKGACKERVYPVGRLDRNTTGLLLMTNDGELTDKITHPSFKQKKIYHVELDKPLKKEHLKSIEEGLELEDGLIKVDEIKYVENTEGKNEVGITLHSGRNRIVRRIFEHFEYKVKKLDRVYFAGLTKKDLARGRWRFLTQMEINMLKMVQ